MTRYIFASSVALAALISSQASYAAAAASSDATGDIVVTAPRKEEEARLKQRIANVIVNVQSAETIQKYPDYNSAEALGRIPGISLSSDTGEGRFVNIRGIDANLNGATYGGVVLLNTFAAGTAASGSGRAVEFDTIPTGAIDGIVVYKTLSPDREAEGLGGQIELTPRSGKNIKKSFVEIELGAGYEPLHRHAGPFTGSFAAGIKSGDLSLVVTGSRKDDQRAVDDTEPSYANDGSTDGGPAVNKAFGRVDFRRYDYSRRRFGYGAELNYKPSVDHNYYARLDIAGYVERSLKNHFYANFSGNPSAPDSKGFVVDTFQPQVDVVNLEETHRNLITTLGGEDKFDKLQIDYHVAYSRATYVEGYYDEARFFGPSGYGRYNNQGNTNLAVVQLFKDPALTVPFVSTDATQYGGPTNPQTRLSAFSENDRDHEYSGAINLRYPVDLFGGTGQLKVGASIRRRSKDVLDFGGFARTNALVLSNYAQSVGPSAQYYFGLYPTAPVANFGAITSAVQAAIPVLGPSLGRDFNDKENVTAGYVMYTGTYGKLDVLAGVRVETTDATYGNYLTTTDTAGNSTVTFVNKNKTYTNAFPTVQLKYTFDPKLQFRATYSTGIARPGFSQAGGNAGVDFTAAPRPVFSAGNPDLKPTTGDNFDIDIEYYLPHGGIIQVGAFDKEFKNYIFKSARINVADPIFLGQNGDFVSYFNESAYARGIEVAYQQRFAGLPGLLAGLGVEANFTVVWSKFKEYSAAVSGDGTDQYNQLPGTSHVTWNLAGFYEYKGLNARLSAQYVGPSLFGLNGDKTIDVIQARRLTMDFTGSYAFSKRATVFVSAKNLLDTPLRYNDGSNNRPQQIEYYGRTYEAGVRFKI
jgi:TonB-dependent receptor